MSDREMVLERIAKLEHELREIRHLLTQIERQDRQILHILKQARHRFSLHVTLEPTMSIGNIDAGSTGQIASTLLDNGQPYTQPFTLSLTYSADDKEVTFSPATTDATNGQVPLEQQQVVTVPAGDPGTSVTITVSSPAPDGSVATGSITIPLTPTPQKFTLSVTQVA